MKVTKLVHSCLLIENDRKKILVDPGIYSWSDQKVKKTDLSGLSAVVVTHAHPDHLNEDFAKAVLDASPDAKWYGSHEVTDILKSLDIEGLEKSEDKDIKFIESQHADLSPWFDKQPEHTSYILFEEVLVSGDCQTLPESYGARILAGAINGGPWGAVVGFSKMIESMTNRPETILPLHDWHWNEEARSGIYARLPEVMDRFGVKFIPLEDCVEREV